VKKTIIGLYGREHSTIECIMMFRDILDAILESLDTGNDIPVLADVEISHIGSDESSIDEALEVFAAAFPQYEIGEVKEFIMSSTNWENSIKATYNDQVIGIYLIGDRQLSEVIKDENAEPTEDLEDYENLIGVEGVALAVAPKAQKIGVGKKLKDALLSMTSADYIFGLQYKSLNNLQHWLKSRRVVAQSVGDGAVFITLQDL